MERLKQIIDELENNKLMKKQLYEFKMQYFQKGIILNYLERWDENE